MSAPELIVRGKRVVLPTSVEPATIAIRDGTVAEILPENAALPGCPIFDAGESVVMPGLVDTHVHINEPGRTEWEGFETATRAAAVGGVTTLIEMPLNSIPVTTTVTAFRQKISAAQGKLHVDVGFWGGIVPGKNGELRALYEEGVVGFKCFLVPSGVAEFPAVTEADLRRALPELAQLDAVLLAHSELPDPIERAAGAIGGASPRNYATWLASRPQAAENEAIELLARLSHEFDAHIHIVHLSSSEAIPLLRKARAQSARITVETCPHYLTFAAEEIPAGATEFKCAPPIREGENRERLWAALGEGVIDLVVSDHSPCVPEMKCRGLGDFLKAWGGIASLELSLAAVWTEAQQRGYSVRHLARWMCEGPARLAKLRKKGSIAVGYDADFVIWNPGATYRVAETKLQQRHKLTPYAGRALSGMVEATFLRGRKIFERGVIAPDVAGVVLKRGAA